MKKNKKTIIVALIFWIPLAIVVWNHSSEESIIMKIGLAIASGPIVFFEAGVAALLVAALFAGSFYLIRNLEVFKSEGKDVVADMFIYAFNGAYGIVFLILYYMYITNQQIYMTLYGGW